MGYEGVVGEGLGEGGALGFAEGSEGWVGEGVVCGVEVMVALGVSDEVEVGFCHG